MILGMAACSRSIPQSSFSGLPFRLRPLFTGHTVTVHLHAAIGSQRAGQLCGSDKQRRSLVHFVIPDVLQSEPNPGKAMLRQLDEAKAAFDNCRPSDLFPEGLLEPLQRVLRRLGGEHEMERYSRPRPRQAA